LLVLLALILRANHSASYFQAIPRASLNCAHSCRAMAIASLIAPLTRSARLPVRISFVFHGICVFQRHFSEKI
jgi:hypothetical protein